MFRQIRPALTTFVAMTILTGILYPLAVTVIAQAAFPRQAHGSLIREGEAVVGSELIGQPFSSPQYFWGRPSATGPFPYNAAASSGSNLGPTNPALIDAVKARVETLRAADPEHRSMVPSELVNASSSGLDPHISPMAADFQIPRVAKARNLDPDVLRDLIRKHTEHRTFGILGEARVNVLKLNLALMTARSASAGTPPIR